MTNNKRTLIEEIEEVEDAIEDSYDEGPKRVELE
jgi:hypothetical protein